MALPSSVDHWLKCQCRAHCVGRYADDTIVIGPIDWLRKVGNEMVRRFERQGIRVNRKKCHIIPLTKPFRFCKAKFTLTETGRIVMNGCRDGVKRARRKLKLFRREWQAGTRTLEDVAQYMTSQLAYYRNYNDHGRILRLRRLCYALFDGRIVCTKSKAKVVPKSA